MGTGGSLGSPLLPALGGDPSLPTSLPPPPTADEDLFTQILTQKGGRDLLTLWEKRSDGRILDLSEDTF